MSLKYMIQWVEFGSLQTNKDSQSFIAALYDVQQKEELHTLQCMIKEGESHWFYISGSQWWFLIWATRAVAQGIIVRGAA